MLAPNTRLVVASHNKGKAREIAELLAPYRLDVISAADLNLPEPEETEDSFKGNAILKAEAALKECGLACLADDSGLSVNAIGGAPGIYSARWAGPEKDFASAMQRVERELAGKADRSAEFVCALALARPGERTEVFEGRVQGQIVWPPRGNKGFGYDPIFVPDGEARTFGEMSGEEKLPLTHRAKAFALLTAALA
ncbi:MAG: RdgB/HAM1 family non-canonical purine NTP pyrophosphatase [Caulobacterales bacterium]